MTAGSILRTCFLLEMNGFGALQGWMMPQLTCVLCLQSAEEQCTRAAATAAMQRLPEDVSSIEMLQPAGVCHLCQTEDYTDDNPLLQVGQAAGSCWAPQRAVPHGSLRAA